MVERNDPKDNSAEEDDVTWLADDANDLPPNVRMSFVLGDLLRKDANDPAQPGPANAELNSANEPPNVPVASESTATSSSSGSTAASPQTQVERPPPQQSGLVYHPCMQAHAPLNWDPTINPRDPPRRAKPQTWHLEDPRRISVIFDRLEQQGLVERMLRLSAVGADRSNVRLIHDSGVCWEVESTRLHTKDRITANTEGYRERDVYVNAHTARAARMAAGCVVVATRAVVSGEVRNALAVVRPPGHHAEPGRYMGFCFYNNVAIAAKVVQRDLNVKRVLIVDWDVHHGNGTQAAFIDDPSVLYISIHRHDEGFYPNSPAGNMDVVGDGEGVGRTVNIPWPRAGFGDGDYLYVFRELVMPMAREFQPELVMSESTGSLWGPLHFKDDCLMFIVSAGFDAARGDPLGGCNVTPAGYARMTEMLTALADGRLVVALEGGYCLHALANCVEAVARVLLGEPAMGEIINNDVSDDTQVVVGQVAKIHQGHWACMRDRE